MNRRKFLTVMGGGIILSAGLTSGCTFTPTKALSPWHRAGSAYGEPRRRALSWAILAPNPHNRQPWLVDLSRPGQVGLYVDTGKMLEHTDPHNRQITIGLGCFLELLRMAAAEDGYRVTIDRFPEGSDATALTKKPVATINFVKDASVQKDPLFAWALKRRSSKQPYDTARAVPDNALSELESAVVARENVGTSNAPEDVDKLRMLTLKSILIEVETPRTYKESVDLFRIGRSEIEKNPDGIDFSGPLFETLAATGMFTREGAMDTSSTGFKQAVEMQKDTMQSAMGYVWLTSKTNTRIDQLNAGRDWVRINLAAAKLEIGLHPVSQALQEYPEMKVSFDQCRQMLAADGGTVQMLGRLGYAEEVSPSPRWLLEEKIIRI